LRSTASFRSRATPRVIYKDLAHQSRGNPEEVRTVLPLHSFLINQS
jgi:hypothetical protein